MGSEKKRKRVSVEPSAEGTIGTPSDKAERKRLKKLKKEAALAAGVSSDENENGTPGNEAVDSPDERSEEVAPLVTPLVSPIATRKFYFFTSCFNLLQHERKVKLTCHHYYEQRWLAKGCQRNYSS